MNNGEKCSSGKKDCEEKGSKDEDQEAENEEASSEKQKSFCFEASCSDWSFFTDETQTSWSCTHVFVQKEILKYTF